MKEIFDSRSPIGHLGRLYHMLDQAAQGRRYSVESHDAATVDCAALTADRDHIVLAANKGEHSIVVRTPETTSYGKWFEEIGFSIGRESKIMKRISQLTRPYALFQADKASNVRMRILEGSSLEKTTDGVVAISQRLYDRIFDATIARLMDLADVSALAVMDMFAKCNVFNGRLWHPGGCIKGQFFVAAHMPRGVDLITHQTNVKGGITLSGDVCYLGMDPQPGKNKAYTNRSMARLCPGTFGCDPALPVTENAIYEWLVSATQARKDLLADGAMTEELEELFTDLCSGRIEQSFTTNSRIKLARWAHVGDIRSNPALLGTVVKSGIERMADLDKLSVRVPIPGATYRQQLSSDAMRLPGVHQDPFLGSIEYNRRYGLWVVSNGDYLANQGVHGGMDGDDKMLQVIRKRGGRPVVWTARNPMGLGEFAVYHLVGDSPVEVPDLELPAMPVRSPDLDREQGKLPVLPSKVSPKKPSGGTFGFDDFIADLKVAGSNPGSVINVMALWNVSHRNQKRCLHLPCMEDVVDSSVQTRIPEDILFIQQGARRAMQELIDGNQPIDEPMFNKCFHVFDSPEEFNAVRKTLQDQGRLRKSWWTRLVDAAFVHTREVVKSIDVSIDAVRVRVDYLKLLGKPLPAKALKMAIDRYKSMCSCTMHDNVPAEFTRKVGRRTVFNSTTGSMTKVDKIIVTAEGYAWMDEKIAGHFQDLVEQFTKWGIVHPVHKVKVALAAAADNPQVGKTGHVLNRKSFFEDYLAMFSKTQS